MLLMPPRNSCIGRRIWACVAPYWSNRRELIPLSAPGGGDEVGGVWRECAPTSHEWMVLLLRQTRRWGREKECFHFGSLADTGAPLHDERVIVVREEPHGSSQVVHGRPDPKGSCGGQVAVAFSPVMFQRCSVLGMTVKCSHERMFSLVNEESVREAGWRCWSHGHQDGRASA